MRSIVAAANRRHLSACSRSLCDLFGAPGTYAVTFGSKLMIHAEGTYRSRAKFAGMGPAPAFRSPCERAKGSNSKSRRPGLLLFQRARPNRVLGAQQPSTLTELSTVYSPGSSPPATWRLTISTCGECCYFDSGGRTDVSNRPHRIAAARRRCLRNEGSLEIAFLE